ncbi:uncharacterized protein LOC141648189 [Silene latifolia]|uniref:uncharacterized protein LOC141648189 n=1 Tax=Silene latifolia TaxID=37657 RepID=UPI003D78B063
MPWDQSVGIPGVKASMAVEGDLQADISELGSDIISEDKLNVESEIMDLGTGMTLKENVGTDTSNLASGEKMTNDSERNNAAGDACMDISGVEKSQQAHVTELSRVLPSNANLKDYPELKKDDVREHARVCDASELLSPMKGEVPRNVGEVPDASKVLPPKKVEDGDATMGIHIFRAETENPDASKTISLMQDQDDDTEIRTKKLTDEGGARLNSPPVLSKCSFAVDGIVLAAQNRDGQSDSKRLVVSRQRKQSKYLSPPYVNLSKGVKASDQENSAVLGDEEGNDLHGSSPPPSKSGSKGKKRELSTKSVVSADNLQDIRASSGELLSELHLAALDCLYPCENEYFDPIEIFFTIFRSSVFRDKSNSEADKKDTGVRRKELLGGIFEENASEMEIKSEAKKRKRKEKPSNGSTTNLLPASLNDGNVNVDLTSPLTGIPVIWEAKPTTPNSLDFSEKDTHSNSESVDFSKDLRKTISVSFEDTEPVSIPDLNGNSMNSNVLAAGSQSEGPSVLTGMPGTKKRGKKKGTVRAITNLDANESFMNSEEPAAGSQSEGPSVLTGMPGPKKRGRKKGIVQAVTNPDGNDSSMNREELAAGSQSEDPSVLNGMPAPRKRGSMERTVLANTNPVGNHERKKRRRRRKDGTYANDLPNADAHILNTTPISLEVCLRNVEPTPPAPMCPLNTSLSPDALPAEAPSLDQVKKSLGLITTMLENSWNNLLPEMKGTLEIEIQGLLQKINTMSSSSSS